MCVGLLLPQSRREMECAMVDWVVWADGLSSMRRRLVGGLYAVVNNFILFSFFCNKFLAGRLR